MSAIANVPHSYNGFKALRKLTDAVITICKNCGEEFSDKNVHTRGGWHWTQLEHICEDCYEAREEQLLKEQGYNFND